MNKLKVPYLVVVFALLVVSVSARRVLAMKSHLVRIASISLVLSFAVIAATALFIAAPAMAQDMLYLNCKCTAITDGGYCPNFTVIVDFGRSTVERKYETGPVIIEPATISATTISTSSKTTQSQPYYLSQEKSFRIDRISGAFTDKNYVVGTLAGPYTLRESGTCTKGEAPKLKF